MDEVKKKWKDARTNVKKKEAMRKKQSKTTGGGPPPEVYFKPWNLMYENKFNFSFLPFPSEFNMVVILINK